MAVKAPKAPRTRGDAHSPIYDRMCKRAITMCTCDVDSFEITYKNLGRRGAESNHTSIEDATNVEHRTVTGETNEKEANTVGDRDEHKRPFAAKVSQTRSCHETAKERSQRRNTAYK